MSCDPEEANSLIAAHGDETNKFGIYHGSFCFICGRHVFPKVCLLYRTECLHACVFELLASFGALLVLIA